MHQRLSRPCLACRRFTVTKRRRSTGQQPGTKGASRPADKPLVKRGFCSPIGLHRISLVRASEESFGTGAKMPWTVRGTVASWAMRSVGVPSCLARPAPPPRRAPPRRDTPMVCSSFGSHKLVMSCIGYYVVHGVLLPCRMHGSSALFPNVPCMNCKNKQASIH